LQLGEFKLNSRIEALLSERGFAHYKRAGILPNHIGRPIFSDFQTGNYSFEDSLAGPASFGYSHENCYFVIQLTKRISSVFPESLLKLVWYHPNLERVLLRPHASNKYMNLSFTRHLDRSVIEALGEPEVSFPVQLLD